MRPLGVDEFEHDAWTIHFQDDRAILRWMRLATEYRLDEHTLGCLVRHVLKYRFSLKELRNCRPRPTRSS